MKFFNWLSNWFNKSEEPDPMKYLIVGIGNIGAEYANTRHNIGFDVADALVLDLDVSYTQVKHGKMATGKFKGRTIHILKPNTYVNLSGKAVKYWADKKSIIPENLLVIVDDLNLNFGSVRMKSKGSHGGHNGLKSIEAAMASSKYSRMRFGIGRPKHKGQQVDFVLGKWSEEEQQSVDESIKKMVQAAKAYTTIGPDRAMTTFNS